MLFSVGIQHQGCIETEGLNSVGSRTIFSGNFFEQCSIFKKQSFSLLCFLFQEVRSLCRMFPIFFSPSLKALHFHQRWQQSLCLKSLVHQFHFWIPMTFTHENLLTRLCHDDYSRKEWNRFFKQRQPMNNIPKMLAFLTLCSCSDFVQQICLVRYSSAHYFTWTYHVSPS